MQQSVLFGILLTLLNKKKVTRNYLAEKFEMSQRTIARYIEVLVESKVPVYGLPGKDGGIYIEEDFSLQKGYFSKDEKARLLTCVEATKSAFNDNINEVLMQKFTDSIQRANEAELFLRTESIYIDSTGWTNPHFYRKKLSLLNESISGAFFASFEYQDQYAIKTTRTVEPYTLVLKEGAWYLYAWCKMRNDYRLFRLSRMTNLKISQDKFNKRPSADATKALSGEFSDTPELTLCMEFSNLVLPDVEEWLGADCIIQRNLKYTAVAIVYAGPKLISKLLSFGSSIKVISPKQLRDEMHVEAQRLLDKYESDF